MQLVDEGKVDLDVPVRTYLPEFEIARRGGRRADHARQLLNHTAGFEGDIFTDTGLGDDCVEKYVGVLARVPQLFPPGEQFSYNNAGYCVLGRLVEVLREKPYDACLREHLFTPLGLTHAATGPYEAIMFRAAVGHIELEPGAGFQPAPVWALARSNAPAGAMLAMRPRDLLAFAADAPRRRQGRRRHPGARARHRAPRCTAARWTCRTSASWATSWGLGFERFDTADGEIIGHDGSTIGQAAFLRMVPEAGVAVALLTNGGDSISLYHDIVGHVIAELADIELPPLPTPPADAGEDRREPVRRHLRAEVADLTSARTRTAGSGSSRPPRASSRSSARSRSATSSSHFRGDSLITVEPEHGMHMPHAFVGDDGAGHALYLHIGRAVRRAGA